jgi:DMSO/TMAO reductase YedYZ molybdopterin-dependent catalytic subunit
MGNQLFRWAGLIVFVCLAGGCASTSPDIATLESVEVRQYQGEKLSSVADFRENSIQGPQNVPLDSYSLKVSGLVDTPLSLTYDQVIASYAHYSKVITLHCVEGWDVTILWEGVLLGDLLKAAGAQGNAVIVIFHAYDGYTSSLPIQYLKDKNILLAYKMNGVTIPPERGFPFVVVAEAKWGYKWVKWVTEIELSNDPTYKGYWEAYGYSSTGDLDQPFLGP